MHLQRGAGELTPAERKGAQMTTPNRHFLRAARPTVGAGLRSVLAIAALLSILAATGEAQCVGDCDGDGEVEINELILGVNISLGGAELSRCPSFDPNGSGEVEINELILAVNNALDGCPPPAETATATVSVSTPTATGSATATEAASPATATATVSAATPTATATEAGTLTPTATEVATADATATATETATGEPTGTATATVTSSATGAATETAVATATATASPAPTDTPTATIPVITATFTPTATPTTGAACGNHLLEPGETCQSCALDCVVQPCTATATTAAFVFDLMAPPGQSPTDVAIRLSYRSEILNIPGTGSVASVLSRIVAPAPAPVPFIRNDQDYAVAITLGRSMPITELFTVTFDVCQGAPAPIAADVSCAVLGCASGGPPIDGCTCQVRTP
jgi:hypothetical protein